MNIQKQYKFRRWHKELEDMIYCETFNDIAVLFKLYTDYSRMYVIMQFTGLVDNKNKDIYEGDIIKHYDNMYYVVKYSEGGYWLYGKTCNKQLTANDEKIITVIGNIFETPELINK